MGKAPHRRRLTHPDIEAFKKDGPVRLCCGERHWTVACNDGLVMCELCFSRFPDFELMRDADDPSKRWNICLSCGERENWAAMVLLMTGGRKNGMMRPRG